MPNGTKCSFKDGNEVRCNFTETNFTTFSVSSPVLFGGFTCGKIHCFQNRSVHVLSSGLSVEIEISEALHDDDTNAKNLLNMNACMHSTETHVSLPHPIFVRPGFIYKISYGPFKDNLRFVSEELKPEMRLQSDILVQQTSRLMLPESQNQAGLICGLDFNEI